MTIAHFDVMTEENINDIKHLVIMITTANHKLWDALAECRQRESELNRYLYAIKNNPLQVAQNDSRD